MPYSKISRAITVLVGLLYCCFFQAASGVATPPSTTEQIEPTDLPSTWWDLLTAEKQGRDKRISALIQKSEEAAKSLSDTSSDKAQKLLEKAKNHLQAYSQVVSQPPPVPKPPTPFAESYTINDLVELNTQYQKTVIDIQTKTDEQAHEQQQIELIQADMDKVRQQYLDAEERSEAKILLALERIGLRPALEVAKTKFSILHKTILIKKQELTELNEEIVVARNRLVSNPRELSDLSRQLEWSKRAWEEKQKALLAKKGEITKAPTDDSSEEGKTQNQTLTLELIEASLKALEARNHYIETEILYSVALLLNEPDKVDMEQLGEWVNNWETELPTFKQSLQVWYNQTERIVRRSAELISLDDEKRKEQVVVKPIILQKNVELGQNNLLTIQSLSKKIEETTFLLKVLTGKSIEFEGQSAQWLRAIWELFYSFLASVKGVFGKTLFHIREHPVTILGVLQFLVIIVGSWWISKIVTRTINQLVRRRKGIRKSAIYRLNRLLHYVILVVGTLVALTVIGFDFSNLLIIAGALGVGLGFGLQSIFNNFISGIIILFQSHLKVGDYVELDNGTRGEIREINVRHTVITTNDGIEILIPNSQMLNNRIINWTLRDPYRRVGIPFSVAYGSDLDEVARVIIETAQKVPCTLEKIGVPEPQVFLSQFGDSALEMQLIVWVKGNWTRRYNKTRSQYLWAIEKALRKHGFVIPFPQRDLHVIEPTKKKK